MGPGPHWAVTDACRSDKEFPDFEIAAGNPLELEDVLRQHLTDLRLYIMHAGWPMIDEILTILWHRPQRLRGSWTHLQVAIPRAEYYDYLERNGLANAGYGDRVMYGSDVGLDDFGSGIDAILNAEFLSQQQKREHPL